MDGEMEGSFSAATMEVWSSSASEEEEEEDKSTVVEEDQDEERRCNNNNNNNDSLCKEVTQGETSVTRSHGEK